MTDSAQHEKPPTVPFKDQSWKDWLAAEANRASIARTQRETPVLPTKEANAEEILGIKQDFFVGPDKDETFRVGIVGAGISGLFTAMLFDHFKEKKGLKVEYEILEANNEDRLGGRLYSYYFKNDQGGVLDAKKYPHAYYDVGAMRFPKIGIMSRTFALFDKLDMNENKSEDPEDRQLGDLVPYLMKGKNVPLLYNGIQLVPKKNQDGKDQEVTAKDFKITGLKDKVASADIGKLLEKKVKRYVHIFNDEGPKEFWNVIMEEVDPYSVRQFLKNLGYDYNTIEFLETFDFGNRWYDQAATEMIMEYLDFSHTGDWWCVEGGSQEIARRTWRALKKSEAVEFGKKVLGMSYVDNCQKVEVNVQGEEKPRVYDAVFNSAPLGAMQHMNLDGMRLDWQTKRAIRNLGYGLSCKVGILFKTQWWRDPKVMTEGPIKGGVAKTDLPLRACVYPSYNAYDDIDKPAVLLASYTWSQEAQRLGSLMTRKTQKTATKEPVVDKVGPDPNAWPQNKEEAELKELLINNLARLHAKSGDEADFARLKKTISEQYEQHYAYDWYQSPLSVGAFAYFGPGQFFNMYPGITASDGKNIIVGEVASAHHAWVVGSLESAVRGVYQFALRHSRYNKAAANVVRAYNMDNVKAPFGPLPAEFDRTEGIKLPPDCTQTDGKFENADIGELLRHKVLEEEIRVGQGGEKLDFQKITEEQMAPVLGVIKPLDAKVTA